MSLAPHSHPDQAVRHSYPLAFRNASFTTAARLLLRTLPYAITRFGILLAVSVITIVWLSLAFGGYAWLGTRIHAVVGIGWLIGLLAAGGCLWRFIVRYGLYLIKCGHIAVLTELVTRGQIGNGDEGMFRYGKRIVTERFGEVNLLFAVDVLVHGIVRRFNRSLDWITRLLPVPGLDSLMAVVKAVVHASTTYVDETIFSYNLARGDENPWRSSRDGLVYYGQNAKPILKTAAWIVVLDKLATIATWVVMLAPAIGIALLLPESMRTTVALPVIGIAALFAANIRAAFIKPFFLIVVMSRFHSETRNQEIDEVWAGRLDQVSDKFGELQQKVTGWVAPKATGTEKADAEAAAA